MKLILLSLTCCLATVFGAKQWTDHDINALSLFSKSLDTAAALTNKKLTDKEVEALYQFSIALAPKFAFIDSPVPLKVGRACVSNSDCARDHICIDMVDTLHDYLLLTNHMKEMAKLKQKAKIYGKECVMDPAVFAKKFSQKQLIERLILLLDTIDSVIKVGLPHYGFNASDAITAKISVVDLAEPMTKQYGGAQSNPLSSIFLLLALRGDSGTSGIDQNLLLLLLSSGFGNTGTGTGTGTVGGGGGLFDNPFLLFTLFNDDNSNSNNGNSDFLLYSLLLNPSTSGGIGGTGGGYGNDFASNPLLLFSLLGNNNSSSGNDLEKLLPFFLLSGQGSTGNSGISSILPFLLLGNNTGDSLPLLLLLGGGGLGGDLLGGTGTQQDPYGAGYGGNDLSSILPLLLLSGDGNTNDLLPILLLSGGLGGGKGTGGDLSSILPLLLLGNSSLFGGSSSSSSSTIDPITLLLLSGGLGGDSGSNCGGGFEGILPLLLLGNSSLFGSSGSNGDNDIFLMLALLGGGLTGGTGGYGTGTNNCPQGGGFESILPFFLLQDSNSSGIDPIVLLLLFSQMSFGGPSGTPITSYPLVGK